MVEPNTPVSMNLFCLTPKIFEYIKNNIKEFFLNQEDLMTCEYLIPTVVGESAKYNNKSIRLLTTDSKYYGMTYREDLEELKSGILSEIEKGTYNKDLWG